VDEERKQLRPFFDQPDVLPIKLKSEAALGNVQGIDWENVTED